MSKRIIKALVGGLKPRTPERSLPSYHEPTPESSARLTREEEAELALKRTAFTSGTALMLVALFVLTIGSVPVIQLIAELRAPRTSASLPIFDVFKTLPSLAKVAAARNLRDLWNLLPHAEDLKSAEKALESDSVVSQWLLPPVQSVLVGRLRAGTEQVYLGRDGWLFYRPDVDYVTGPPFLAPSRLEQRGHAARIQPDPIKAIVQFRDQLAARGIDLLVLPIPTKATLEGEKLSAKAPRDIALQNSSFAEFKTRLAAAGVDVFDPTPSLMRQKATAPDAPLYLQTDTHWRPETMALVAQQAAATLKLLPTRREDLQTSKEEITALGDVARMLKLPAGLSVYRPETVAIQQVTIGNGLWRPSSDADVLLLGDSFANIFSLAALGWGESAGFAEHLSLALQGRPLDCILRNSDGAFATREMLANELARGRDRLAGKKLVVWEFSARELAFGNWKLLDLQLGHPAAARFYSPAPGKEVEVTGTVEAVSSIPRAGTVPYRDHIMAVHLADIAHSRTDLKELPNDVLPESAVRDQGSALQAVVYLWSMRDNIWTPAARLRPGDQVRLRLRAWGDVSARYEQINRSDLDDAALQLEEPVWGEWVK
ncbi:MAG TPA: hypothetical protein VK474_12185 [Chthoniobacterales bacterium]|nr:hypothetical protein [Chthoniobacterales bacterium]